MTIPGEIPDELDKLLHAGNGCVLRVYLQRHAERKGRIFLELEFIEDDSFVSFPADEQGFGRVAGCRPTLDERAEVDLRVNPLVACGVEQSHSKSVDSYSMRCKRCGVSFVANTLACRR